MRYEKVYSDITVIGGGLAGVCAAVAAARLGRSVALVQNRPVLGGNSSSEVRVWVCGGAGFGVNRYGRETGIMGELLLENQYRNPEGNPYVWDVVVLETVLAEKNIRLFLNTDVHEIEADGDENQRTIHSVTGWMTGSERKIRFESDMYLDCTGDGLIGFLAGAKFRIGREAKHEYHESLAQEVADDVTLGSTMFFYTKDAGSPVRYIAPSFAKDITKTSIPMKRIIRSGDSGCHYWWIEWGGEDDIVHDNERIRDELWAVIYGIWDYIKNSGKFDADRLTLEWVGAVPGKREYRRFIGDYVLNQNDILDQTPFEDRIAFGGWSIDLHPPGGMYSMESGSKHIYSDGNYHIPFRTLYSTNVSNLMFAGRNISATHVAFGSTRVMGTCAILGEAAGTGAALCISKKVYPRQLYLKHMKEFHQILLRQDASVIGLTNEDGADFALQASVSASSSQGRICLDTPAEGHPRRALNNDLGLILPVNPALDGIELLVDCDADTVLELEVWNTGRAENYSPHTKMAEAKATVTRGNMQWVRFNVAWTPDIPQNAFVIVRENPSISLYLSNRLLFGVLAFVRGAPPEMPQVLEEKNYDQKILAWSMKPMARQMVCIRCGTETRAYLPANVTDGYVRPYGGPHIWSSSPMSAGNEEWIELEWKQPVRACNIHLTFNDDVNEYLINLHFLRTPFVVIPELVRDYRIEAWSEGRWNLLLRETCNRKRKRVYRLERPVCTTKLRLVIERTNGSPRAEVVEIRVYDGGNGDEDTAQA